MRTPGAACSATLGNSTAYVNYNAMCWEACCIKRIVLDRVCFVKHRHKSRPLEAYAQFDIRLRLGRDLRVLRHQIVERHDRMHDRL